MGCCCVFQRGIANPSQESLFLSISGSGSLHSWNLETTDELSDLTENSDWPGPDTSVPEEEESESGLLAACEIRDQEREQREYGGKQEEVKVAINGNQGEEIDDRNNFKEVKFKEERKKEDQEERVSLGDDSKTEISEQREDEGLKEKGEDDRNQPEEIAEGHKMERETDKMQEGAAREEEKQEDKLEKDKEATGSSNKLIKLNLQDPDTVEQTASPETTAPPAPQSLAADPQPPAGQEKTSEEAVKKEEREIRQTPTPPKVLSAVTRFQSQASSQSFQVKSRIKGSVEPGRPYNMLWNREHTQTHPPCDPKTSEENNRSEAHEGEDPPLIKVSELKKRFEA